MRRTEDFWIEFNPTAPVAEAVSERPAKKDSVVFDILDSVKGAIIVVIVVFTFLFRAVGVDGDSMVPTLHHGDWIAVSGMLFSDLEYGDIVVVTQPWERNVPIVKRVIGVGGDTVDINFETGDVSVNGKVLEEKYINEKTSTFYDVAFPVVVPEGKLFVMGDNRNISLDSRSSKIGMIDERYVLGRTLFRFHPISDWKIPDVNE